MDRYYQPHYGTDDKDSRGGMMDASSLKAGGQSLGDIVNQNNKAMRRRSAPLHYSTSSPTMDDANMRRVSMMGSNASPGMTLDMSFDPGMDDIMANGSSYPVYGTNELPLNTHFQNQANQYNHMPAVSSASAYASPLNQNTPMDVGLASPYLTNELGMPVGMNDLSLTGMNHNDMGSLSMYQQFDTSMMASPMATDFGSQRPMGNSHDASVVNSDTRDYMHSTEESTATPETRPSRPHSNENNAQPDHRADGTPLSIHGSSNQHSRFSYDPESGSLVDPRKNDKQSLPWEVPAEGFPSTMSSRPHTETQFKNAYSSSGFDMLGVLMRVATRSNPEINIGSVDLSCSFVVCDLEKEDVPIVYCSENFERLTGYSKHMILGRNCRFLQSPDGKVESGIKRRYVDNESIYYLKRMVQGTREAQISLINYRRGGQPFMNLLTMIPISWDDSRKVKYFVGFQVDLVEQPNAVSSKNPDGSFNINYQRGFLPPYMLHFPEGGTKMDISSQTVSRDEVSNALANYASMQDGEFARRLWDKVLLENSDDVIHVLSLKGLFLYLSASCAKVLEYEPSELVGMALSSVCHPSDIVPVTRELKDTTPGVSVNVVYRIRRKTSGYMWFEGHGALHTEQGKGRKCIIMVGRERPVYTLSQRDIQASGGIIDSELWTKMSTSGMFLFVSSNVRQLLDRQSDDLVGTSMQSLMRAESKVDFAKMLEFVRTGRKVSFKHDMINKRGQVIQAFTNLYPGDATEGHKPTFIVAQTRFSKMSRGSAAYRALSSKYDTDSAGSIGASFTTSTGANVSSGGSLSGRLFGTYKTTEGTPVTFSGQQALSLGNQDATLASDDNLFEELKVTRSSSWQYELRQMEKQNRILADEVQSLLAAKKKRKRRKGAGQLQKDCANCHTRTTPEWRRGPSGNRDLCNSCGLRWAKQNGRVSPRTSPQQSIRSSYSDKASRASGSPKYPSINEASGTATNASSGKQPLQRIDSDGHTSKSVKRDLTMSQSLMSGRPAKIEEGIEPE